jgi:hypothetical protein
LRLQSLAKPSTIEGDDKRSMVTKQRNLGLSIVSTLIGPSKLAM